MNPGKALNSTPIFKQLADRAIAWLGLLLAGIVMVGLAASDWTARADHQLRTAREGVLSRNASQTIHIAEIDSKSIAALKAWPWPREIHGQLVDRLKAAGARTIAFDVDFSASTGPASDAAFTKALQRAGGDVILPTFRQRAQGVEGGFVENLPIAPLREQAFLASVNVHPDADGVMRTFTYGTTTAGITRPALPAMLAGAPGRIGETFPVNSSILPASIPRHSVVDILEGRAGQAELRGKIVLIGATAIELGDRYAMPRHGIQPGVVIQALAAETLLQGIAFPNFGMWLPALVVLIALMAIGRSERYAVAIGIATTAILLGMPLALEHARIGTIEVAASLVAFCVGFGTVLLGRASARFDLMRLTDAASGLPNERALRRALATFGDGFLIVMRIRNYDEISELMAEEHRRKLLEQLCARISLGTGASQIYSLGNGRLAWTVRSDDLNQLTESIEGLCALFAARIGLGSHRITVAPAFGIAGGADCADPAHADLAASRAAALGCRWFVYSADLAGSTGRAQQLLADLDDAMAAGQIYLVFQPKLTLSSNRIESVEALVRWQHPTLGPIPPDQFIPVLEESGRMSDLTLFILDRCSDQAGRWQDRNIDVSIAINVSAPLFADATFVGALFVRIDALGERAARLAFEITESAAVLHDEAMIESLRDLRERGLRISIDDYGTGQSTLSYLKKFPADEIKIDQSFVRNLTSETNDQILVRSTIAMAHELGYKVVAEGVEDAESMEMLASFGCDAVQGWHIGRGVRAEELEPRLLQDEPSLRAAA